MKRKASLVAMGLLTLADRLVESLEDSPRDISRSTVDSGWMPA